ncbi:hypothetical protein [Mesorhizobium sp. B4-1-4]|uniref:hypothetical protein n=1 Tax=Mesorhizobium sp. B4-1-4 TaxID=2589888 RepID=UPI00112AC2D6|nr:hypothetical protein [Mesorhizobium sp. B4-1-4]UCI30505.1 hypothetical protein FJW03_22240 [Mesorhizobium sp. B4-1-4]
MSRKLLLTQKQITAICKGASKAGYVPVIETPGGMNIRLLPASGATAFDQHPADRSSVDNVKVSF